LVPSQLDRLVQKNIVFETGANYDVSKFLTTTSGVSVKVTSWYSTSTYCQAFNTYIVAKQAGDCWLDYSFKSPSGWIGVSGSQVTSGTVYMKVAVAAMIVLQPGTWTNSSSKLDPADVVGTLTPGTYTNNGMKTSGTMKLHSIIDCPPGTVFSAQSLPTACTTMVTGAPLWHSYDSVRPNTGWFNIYSSNQGVLGHTAGWNIFGVEVGDPAYGIIGQKPVYSYVRWTFLDGKTAPGIQVAPTISTERTDPSVVLSLDPGIWTSTPSSTYPTASFSAKWGYCSAGSTPTSLTLSGSNPSCWYLTTIIDAGTSLKYNFAAYPDLVTKPIYQIFAELQAVNSYGPTTTYVFWNK
jgi:hypothetical protein